MTTATYANTITQEMERLAANPTIANRSLLRFLAKQSPDMTLGEAMAKYFARF